MKANRFRNIVLTSLCGLAAMAAAVWLPCSASADPVSEAAAGSHQLSAADHEAEGDDDAPPGRVNVLPVEASPDRHILKRFDFDERKYGNLEEIPMYWLRRRGPNLPHYNLGQFDRQVGHDAPPSFCLHTVTESIAFTYSRNDIPVEPGSRHLITAWVRTKNLHMSRAYLSAAYMTRDLNVLEQTEVSSEPIGGSEQEQEWRQIELATLEAPRIARFLQITVWLAQPEMLQRDLDPSLRPIAEQDTGATAWFDDIEVTHLLPLASIRTLNDIPVVAANQPAQVLGPRENPGHYGLTCRITISDESGRQCYQAQTDPRRLGDAPPAVIRLDDLPPSLYTGRLQVFSRDRQITEQKVRFVKLPALVQMASSRIGVCLDEATLKAPEATIACIRGLQASAVKIPIWTRRTTDTQIAQGHPGAESLLRRILADGVDPVGMIIAPPAGMTSGLLPNQRNLVDVFTANQQVWQPYLALSLTHYADVVRLWQVGADGELELAGDERYPAAVDLAGQQIVTLIDGAQVAIAWPGLLMHPQSLPNIKRASIYIPDAVRPDQIPQYVSQHSQDGKAIWVTLEPLKGQRYSPSVRRSDIARRVVFSLAGGAETVFVPQPWEVDDAGAQALLAPTVEYTALATLSRALAGKHYTGKFEWIGGVVFHTFAGAEDAALVAWNEQPVEPHDTHEPVSLHIGRQVAAYDLRGRPVPIGGKDVQTLSIGSEPIVITGADYHVARLRSLFDVQPRQVASGLRRHRHTVTLVNPYPEPINGTIRLRGPEGWEIMPPRLNFSLQPDKALRQPIELHIPYNEPVGPKTITADLTVDSRRMYQMSIPVSLDLQLPGVETYAFTDSTPDDVVIRHVVTNRTNEELNFVGSVLLPEAGRQERYFLHIRPGQTMVKEYIIPRSQVKGQSQLRLSLRDINGSRLLNQMVEIF